MTKKVKFAAATDAPEDQISARWRTFLNSDCHFVLWGRRRFQFSVNNLVSRGPFDMQRHGYF